MTYQLTNQVILVKLNSTYCEGEIRDNWNIELGKSYQPKQKRQDKHKLMKILHKNPFAIGEQR
jgi:hypothetical protein